MLAQQLHTARFGAALRPSARLPARAAARPRVALAPARASLAAANPLADEKASTAVFGLAAAAYGASAAGALLAPAKFGAAVGLTAAQAATSTVTVYGALALVVATAAARLAVAAQKGRLGSDTYQRLALSVAAVAGGSLYVQLSGGASLAAMAAGDKAQAAVAAVVAAGAVSAWAKASTRPASLVKDVFGAVGDVFSAPSSLASAVYAAATVAAALLGAQLLGAVDPAPVVAKKGAAVVAPAVTACMKHAVGVLAVGAAGVAFTLKDGADRGRLARGTFKQLNEAAAVAAAVLAAVAYRAAGGALTPGAGALGGLALFCAYQGVMAVAARSGALSVAEDRGNYKYEKEDPLENFCSTNPDAEECKVFDD